MHTYVLILAWAILSTFVCLQNILYIQKLYLTPDIQQTSFLMVPHIRCFQPYVNEGPLLIVKKISSDHQPELIKITCSEREVTVLSIHRRVLPL